VRFFKARTRRPKHKANDYWDRTANTPHLPMPLRMPIISRSIPMLHLGLKAGWHPTKGIRNKAAVQHSL
jgi:hypothetical protein